MAMITMAMITMITMITMAMEVLECLDLDHLDTLDLDTLDLDTLDLDLDPPDTSMNMNRGITACLPVGRESTGTIYTTHACQSVTFLPVRWESTGTCYTPHACQLYMYLDPDHLDLDLDPPNTSMIMNRGLPLGGAGSGLDLGIWGEGITTCLSVGRESTGTGSCRHAQLYLDLDPDHLDLDLDPPNTSMNMNCGLPLGGHTPGLDLDLAWGEGITTCLPVGRESTSTC